MLIQASRSGFAHLVNRARNGKVQGGQTVYMRSATVLTFAGEADRGRSKVVGEEGAESVSSALKAQQVSSPKLKQKGKGAQAPPRNYLGQTEVSHAQTQHRQGQA